MPPKILVPAPPRSPPNHFNAVVQQRPGFDLEPRSDARDVVDRDITFRPFDPAEIGAVDAAVMRQPPQLSPTNALARNRRP
jgi:hypothetical protein